MNEVGLCHINPPIIRVSHLALLSMLLAKASWYALLPGQKPILKSHVLLAATRRRARLPPSGSHALPRHPHRLQLLPLQARRRLRLPHHPGRPDLLAQRAHLVGSPYNVLNLRVHLVFVRGSSPPEDQTSDGDGGWCKNV